MRPTLAVLLLAALLLADPLAAQERADSAAFIIRLGTDTTAIERYVRTPGLLSAEAVQRSPGTLRHRLQLRIAPDGRISGGDYQVLPPGAAAPTASRTWVYPARPGDSLVVEVSQGGTVRRTALAADDAIPVIGPFYSLYELAVQRLVRAGTPAGRAALLAGTTLGGIDLRRTATDSVALANQFGEPMHARVDATGRIIRLHTPAFVTVERASWVDLDRLAADFAARDAAGRGLGPLSPRSTSRTRVGEANLWLDYSRPAVRGRPVWGRLVPFGEVWRLGANDATHLATDRALRLGDLLVPPGTYTLYLLPAADRWTLIVNRRTGVSGLDYRPDADLGRVPLTLETPDGAVEQLTVAVTGGARPRLEIAWADRRGSVPLSVVQ